MLKTAKKLIDLMKNQKKQLYSSFVLTFLDGCLVIVPLLAAFLITSGMPEFCPNVKHPLMIQDIIEYSTIMAVSIIIRIVMRYFTLYFRSGAGYKCMSLERKTLGKELRKVPLGYFNEKNLGDLVSTITSDAAFLEIEGMGVIEKIAVGIPTFIIGLIICLFFDCRIFLLVLLLLFPTWFAYSYLSTRQDKLNINRQEFIGQVTEDTLEFIKGLHVLKSYNIANKGFTSDLPNFLLTA